MKAIAWSILVAFTASAPASSSPPGAGVEQLDRDHSPFLADFSGSAARARLVAILSPT